MAVDKTKFEELIKRSSKKYYTFSIVIGILVLIGTALIGIFVIKPLYSETGELSGELKTKKEELSYLEEKRSKLEELKSKEEGLLEDAAEVGKALPTITEVGGMLIQLDQIALLSGGLVSGINGEEGQGSNTDGETTTSSSMISTRYYNGNYTFSDYFGMKSMIEKAENALRLINFEDFSIQAGESDIFSVDIKIKAYVRNE